MIMTFLLDALFRHAASIALAESTSYCKSRIQKVSLLNERANVCQDDL